MRRRGPEALAAAAFAAAIGGAEMNKAQADTSHIAKAEAHDATTKKEKTHADHNGNAHTPKVTAEFKLEGDTHKKAALIGSLGGEGHVKLGGKEALAGGALALGVKLDEKGYAGNLVGAEGALLFKLGKSPVYGGPAGAAMLDLRRDKREPGAELAFGGRLEVHPEGAKGLVLGAEAKGLVEIVPEDGKGAKANGGAVAAVTLGSRF